MIINRRHFLIGLALSGGATLWTQACGLGATPTNTQVSQQPVAIQATATATTKTVQILRASSPGAAKQLDPAFYITFEDNQIGQTLFDRLIWVDYSLTPQPMLAESWEATTSHSWTFKVREGVYFHHGTLFSAQDVIHTFERLLSPRTSSPYRNSLQFIDKVEARDDYTVQFHLRSPNPDLPLLLSSSWAGIIPHDLPSNLLSFRPSGTGPFQLEHHEANVRTQVVRNPNYWQPGQPGLDGIDFLVVPYEQQSNALDNGHVDLLLQIGAEELADLQANPSIKIAKQESGSYQNIVMRATTKPFTNPMVREAFKFCVDRHAMQMRVLNGSGVPANDHPVPRISPFGADLPLRPYNPDQARMLLAKAGYPQGVQIDLLTSTVRPGMEAMARSFQAMAKPAGITARVVSVPASVYWSDYAGRVPFHTSNWGFFPSIDETFRAVYYSTASGNETGWRNSALDQLIDQARSEANQADRKALYAQAQQLLMQDGAVIIPYFKPVLQAMRTTVQDLTPHPTGLLDFRTIKLAGA
jgi:peptide/nickel transport system substrate-binding protein